MLPTVDPSCDLTSDIRDPENRDFYPINLNYITFLLNVNRFFRPKFVEFRHIENQNIEDSQILHSKFVYFDNYF